MRSPDFSPLFIWLAVIGCLFITNNSWPAVEEVPYNQLSKIDQEIIAELDLYLQYDLLDNLDCIEGENLENKFEDEQEDGDYY